MHTPTFFSGTAQRRCTACLLATAILLLLTGAGPAAVDEESVEVVLRSRWRGRIDDMAFSPDGTLLAFVDGYYNVSVCDVAGRRILTTIAGQQGNLVAVRFPDQNQIVTAGNVRTEKDATAVTVWDLRKEHPLQARFVPGKCLALDEKGELLATTQPARNHSVTISNLGKAPPGVELQGQRELVVTAAFSPDGKYVATAHPEHVALRDAQTGKEIRTIGGIIEARTLCFSKVARILVTQDPHTRFWGVVDGKELYQTMSLNRRIAFSPDGPVLADMHPQDGVRFFDFTKRKFLGRLSYKEPIARWVPNSFAISPDGTRVAAGGDPGAIRIWEPRSAK